MNTKNTNAVYPKLLTAAKEIFKQKGFNATTIRDIAKSADSSVSLIYYYFPNGKLGIAKYLFNNFLEECGNIINGYINNNDDPLLYALVHLRFFLRELMQDENELNLYIQSWLQPEEISAKRSIETFNAMRIRGIDASYKDVELIMVKTEGIWCSLYSAKILGFISISHKEIRDETDMSKMLLMGIKHEDALKLILQAEQIVDQIPICGFKILN